MKRMYELIEGNNNCFLNYFNGKEWIVVEGKKCFESEAFVVIYTDYDSREYRVFAKNDNEAEEISEPCSAFTNEELSKRDSAFVFLNKAMEKYLLIIPAELCSQSPLTFEFDFYDDFQKVCIKGTERYKIKFWCERGIEKDDTLYAYFSFEKINEKEPERQEMLGAPTLLLDGSDEKPAKKKFWQFWKR